MVSRENLQKQIIFYKSNYKALNIKSKILKPYLDDIFYYTKKLDKYSPTFLERLKSIINNITERPDCPVCGKIVDFSIAKSKYKSFCSPSCQAIMIQRNISPEQRIEMNQKAGKKISEAYHNKTKDEKEILAKNASLKTFKQNANMTKEQIIAKALKCSIAGLKQSNGWEDDPKGLENGIIYLIRMYNDYEEFWKMGRTCYTVEHRYKNLKNYKYDIVETKTMTNTECFYVEINIHKRNIKYKHIPKKRFDGWMECYNKPISLEV